MNLNHLYYFRTIAKLRHFTNAAAELNISQPSLSYAVNVLEEELGTHLFEKQGRNVVLTKYGKVFLEYVEASLDKLESGIKEVKKLTSPTEGLVYLAYVDPLAPRYIPKIVKGFLELQGNKDIRFTYILGITPDLIKGLKTDRYDIVFCSKVEDEEGIIFHPILKQDLVLAVPPNHSLASKKLINLKDIVDYPLVTYNKTTGLGKLVFEIFKAEDITPNIISEAYNEAALYGLVSEGLAISLVAHTPEISNYNIKTIPIDNPLCKRYIHLAFMKNKYLPPAVHKFITFVKESKIDI